MNELDFVLLFVILLGVVAGLRRCLVRLLISVVGMYFIILVAGYLYDVIGWTLADAFNLGLTGMHNFSYLLVVVIMTFIVELISYKFFEATQLLSLRKLDNLLGGVVGVFYGALWAAIVLILIQYGIVRTGGSLRPFVEQSTLAPNLNAMLDQAVFNILRPLFTDGLPNIHQAIYQFL
jgi:uncharacterized membrane protein required for colicin V production